MMQLDEVTGKQTHMQRRWEAGDGPNVPFSHHVVSKSTVCGVGSSYALGSLQECREWQMKHGVRSTTDIIPW